MISFSEGSAFETLHAYVSSAMAPFFKSFVKETGKSDRCLFFLLKLLIIK